MLAALTKIVVVVNANRTHVMLISEKICNKFAAIGEMKKMVMRILVMIYWRKNNLEDISSLLKTTPILSRNYYQ